MFNFSCCLSVYCLVHCLCIACVTQCLFVSVWVALTINNICWVVPHCLYAICCNPPLVSMHCMSGSMSVSLCLGSADDQQHNYAGFVPHCLCAICCNPPLVPHHALQCHSQLLQSCQWFWLTFSHHQFPMNEHLVWENLLKCQ